MLHGLQLFYNLCYRCVSVLCDVNFTQIMMWCYGRCESGQEAILTCCNPDDFIGGVVHNHSGDSDVMRQCRRLELALKHNGWRGQVETLITREMLGEALGQEHLQRATFTKK